VRLAGRDPDEVTALEERQGLSLPEQAPGKPQTPVQPRPAHPQHPQHYTCLPQRQYQSSWQYPLEP